jgi:hypothetical protein
MRRMRYWAEAVFRPRRRYGFFFSFYFVFSVLFSISFVFSFQIHIKIETPNLCSNATIQNISMNAKYIFLYIYINYFILLFRQRPKIWHAHVLFYFRNILLLSMWSNFKLTKNIHFVTYLGEIMYSLLPRVTSSWIYFYLRAFFKFHEENKLSY